jgi:methylated-DNA-[protein]-cysteine S-methyltransferase
MESIILTLRSTFDMANLLHFLWYDCHAMAYHPIGENMKKIRGINALPSSAVYDEINSPVGKLIIVASSEGLHAILWDVDRDDTRYEKIISALSRARNDKIIMNTKKQLEEYFQGSRKNFDLPLILKGSDFQIQAWKTLLSIPYGKTFSYAKQAMAMGDKNKARAVGMANGQNPISIVIPCHRVIGSNGNLVGFAGGMEKKKHLLDFERMH